MPTLRVDLEPADTLVLLQNAWAYWEQVEPWPYHYWLGLLADCRTGQRLKLVLPDWTSVKFVNTTDRIGVGSNSKLPPNVDYVKEAFTAINPSLVIACGEQARNVATKHWPGRLLCIPHPACRVVTNAVLKKARRLLVSGNFNRIVLKQGVGKIITEKLHSPVSSGAFLSSAGQPRKRTAM